MTCPNSGAQEIKLIIMRIAGKNNARFFEDFIRF
jgi:hypothetical protein